MFFIEATGFGRGAGALDLSKDNVAKMSMLDPSQIDSIYREKIVSAFKEVSNTSVKKVTEYLADDSCKHFNHTVLQAFGIDEHYHKIEQSLTSMIQARVSAQ